MKKALTIIVTMFFTYCADAQTNTFPSSGNVGIGTTSPNELLDVQGNTPLSSFHVLNTIPAYSSTLIYGQMVQGNSTAYDLMGLYNNTNTLKYEVRGDGQVYMTGNLGIGTANPVNMLQIGSVGNYGYSGNAIALGDGNNVLAMHYGSTAYLVATGNLAIGGGQNLSNQLFLSNSGKIGIGTNSPRDRLDLSVDRGFNILLGDRGAFGSLLSSAGTVIGQNVKADNAINAQMSLINTTADGASAIKLQYNEGITFHTTNNGGSAGSAFSSERVRITPGGDVAIGTTDPLGYKLAVNGSVVATSITVKLYANWPDYVFRPTYHLPSLATVKAYIDRNQHLREMPTEQEVKDNGINLGQIVQIQTKKIEELTLYLIEKDKQVEQLQEQVKQLRKDEETRLAAIEKKLAKMASYSK